MSSSFLPSAPVLAPSITKLPDCAGAVLVTGSHGGRYSGRLAIAAQARAAIFHDAGIGLDEAGVASLPMLGKAGIAAVAASHMSCRVGDSDDMMRRGAISRVNSIAAAVGVRVGMSCRQAASVLQGAPYKLASVPEAPESRSVRASPHGGRPIVLIDSASLVDPEQDVDSIVVTGSHGGLIGSDPGMALRVAAFAAVFNDAGIGIESAGITRLAALDARGIAAFVVAAATARIGEAVSTYAGTISVVNQHARLIGAEEGMTASSVLTKWAR